MLEFIDPPRRSWLGKDHDWWPQGPLYTFVRSWVGSAGVELQWGHLRVNSIDWYIYTTEPIALHVEEGEGWRDISVVCEDGSEMVIRHNDCNICTLQEERPVTDVSKCWGLVTPPSPPSPPSPDKYHYDCWD